MLCFRVVTEEVECNTKIYYDIVKPGVDAALTKFCFFLRCYPEDCFPRIVLFFDYNNFSFPKRMNIWKWILYLGLILLLSAVTTGNWEPWDGYGVHTSYICQRMAEWKIWSRWCQWWCCRWRAGKRWSMMFLIIFLLSFPSFSCFFFLF